MAWTSRPAAQVILSSLKAAPSPHPASRPFTPTCLSCERAQCPGAGWGALEDLASWSGAHLQLSHPPFTPFLSETSVADGGFPGPASEPGGGENLPSSRGSLKPSRPQPSSEVRGWTSWTAPHQV